VTFKAILEHIGAKIAWQNCRVLVYIGESPKTVTLLALPSLGNSKCPAKNNYDFFVAEACNAIYVVDEVLATYFCHCNST
jgi:hypothetical protein